MGKSSRIEYAAPGVGRKRPFGNRGVTLSLALAHYRDVAALGVIGTSGGALAMTNLGNNPFGLAELQSWILFFMGWLFWAIAAMDRYKLDDPIPGYGQVAAAKDRAYSDYLNSKRK